MSGTTEIRCAVEIREDYSRQSPGRLYGVLMRYGERAKDRAERFLPGALTWPDGGIVVTVQHDRRQAVARVTPIERDGELVIDAPVPDTAARARRADHDSRGNSPGPVGRIPRGPRAIRGRCPRD